VNPSRLRRIGVFDLLLQITRRVTFTKVVQRGRCGSRFRKSALTRGRLARRGFVGEGSKVDSRTGGKRAGCAMKRPVVAAAGE